MIVAILLAAFLVSRSCGSVGGDVSQKEAIEIAKDQIDYEPDGVQVRLFRKGVQSRPYWGVSLYTGPRQNPFKCRVVQIDANSGDVTAVNRC